jgi:hypothetical protein
MTDNPSPKTVILQGEPGTGKSMMAGLTAVHKPVHFMDIDRKIQSAGWAREAIAKGEITYWELNEPTDEENLKSRITQLAKGEKLTKPPQGWIKFAEYYHKLPQEPAAKAAGTWVVDSATFLNEHMKSQIMYLAGKSKYEWDQWNALKIGWLDTFGVMRDLAKENHKDLIVTVHEREKEKVGEKSRGVTYETDIRGNRTRIVGGTQDLKIWASIDGAFGELIGAPADEYYWLHVVMVNGNPVWKCRVHPDGMRALRTSFVIKDAEQEPDFRKIWK